jgi:hypothetical protein
MLLETILNFLLQADNIEVLEKVVKETSEPIKIFGIKLINVSEFTEMAVRFILNTIVTFVIARGLYYTHANRKDYLFTYLLIGLITFLLCFTLSSVKLQIGFALGLFAIFGIIRYRTDAIPIKEMTYLFVVIGVSVINALANKKVSYAELFFANVVVLLLLYILEYLWLVRHESVKKVVYEKIDLIKPERREELIQDLEERTGIKVSRVEVGKIDFLRDIASLNVYYFESDQINQADMQDSSSYSRDDD